MGSAARHPSKGGRELGREKEGEFDLGWDQPPRSLRFDYNHDVTIRIEVGLCNPLHVLDRDPPQPIH